MKLKINKACDLSSISVLPQSRRGNNVPTGPESSVFGKNQASQLRSQPSQQSFSQGGMFSQLSQNSLDEIMTNNQRFGSQERENSVKSISCLPPISYTREDSQIPISRTSTNLMHGWNSASVPDYQCQINEALEHKIGMMETSLDRLGVILDSVQSDIMQVNKGIKEVSMEMEGIRQKLIVHNNSLQLMNQGQEDIKISLEGGLKSISHQIGQDIYREILQQISLALSALPEKIDASLQKLKFDLCKTFSQEMQATVCSLKISNQKHLTPSALPEKVISYRATPQQMPRMKDPAMPPKLCGQATLAPNKEVGSWTSVKRKQSTFQYRTSNKEHKKEGVSPIELEREGRVVTESDEEIGGGLSCLLEEREADIGNYSMAEAKEESERILRKARRRKRKYCNLIILD